MRRYLIFISEIILVVFLVCSVYSTSSDETPCQMPPLPHRLHFAYVIEGAVPTCPSCGYVKADIEEFVDYNGKTRIFWEAMGSHFTVPEIYNYQVTSRFDLGKSWFVDLNETTCINSNNNSALLVQFGGMWPGGLNVSINGWPERMEKESNRILYLGEAILHGVHVEKYRALNDIILLNETYTEIFDYFWKYRTNELFVIEAKTTYLYYLDGEAVIINAELEANVTLWEVNMDWSSDILNVLGDCEDAAQVNPTPPGTPVWYMEMNDLTDYRTSCPLSTESSSILSSVPLSNSVPLSIFISDSGSLNGAGLTDVQLYSIIGTVAFLVVACIVGLVIVLHYMNVKRLERVSERERAATSNLIENDIHPGLSGFAPIIVVNENGIPVDNPHSSISSSISPFSSSPALHIESWPREGSDERESLEISQFHSHNI